MTAQIIDGKALSKQLRVGFRERVGRLVEQGVRPGLAVILVGDNPASRVYVGNKVKACEECGVRSVHVALRPIRWKWRCWHASPSSTPTPRCTAS